MRIITDVRLHEGKLEVRRATVSIRYYCEGGCFSDDCEVNVTPGPWEKVKEGEDEKT